MIFMNYRFDGIETWWPWLKSEEISFSPNTPLANILIPTKESGCISNWLQESINADIPIILVGNSSTGKTATVQHYLNQLPKDKYLSNTLNFASNIRAQQIQEMVMSKLDRRRKGVFGPPVGKSVMICIFVFPVLYNFKQSIP